MKITHVETIALQDEQSHHSETIVRVHTDQGLTGIGQAEAPALVIDAIIRHQGGLQTILEGEAPSHVHRLWQKMYDTTGLYGRRGVTIAAIGAIETALWDITGKALGKPVHELIWRSFTTTKGTLEPKRAVTPYVTVYPSGGDIATIRERVEDAIRRGYRAVKIEEGEGMFGNVDLATDVKVVEAVRDVLGPARD